MTTPAILPSARLGADTEVGTLRTVMLHRPGAELKRLTPRNNDSLLFDGIPWVGRAQDEHDAFAQALRDRDVEVLYLTDLLTETLADPDAHKLAIDELTSSLRLGDTVRDYLVSALADYAPQDLAGIATAGLRNDEVSGVRSIVTRLLDHDAFLIDPLPNLLFTRDSSVWLRDRVAVTSLAMPARARETQLTELIYAKHPRFAGIDRVYGGSLEHVEGGDILQLASGVIAIGVGERTTPAGCERFARQLFSHGLVHTVLAVPVTQERATMHLDTIATMVDVDKVVMYPNIAHTLVAHTVTTRNPVEAGTQAAPGQVAPSRAAPGQVAPSRAAPGQVAPGQVDLEVGDAEPFFTAAARAMGIERLGLIDTGLDPVTAEREQWDDGNNTLAISPRVAVAYARNVETNARLEANGIEVIALEGSELGSGRGGPRCMSCPIVRDGLAAR